MASDNARTSLLGAIQRLHDHELSQAVLNDARTAARETDYVRLEKRVGNMLAPATKDGIALCQYRFTVDDRLRVTCETK